MTKRTGSTHYRCGRIQHHDKFYIHRVKGRGYLDNFFAISSIESDYLQDILEYAAKGGFNKYLDRLPTSADGRVDIITFDNSIELIRKGDDLIAVIYPIYTYKVISDVLGISTTLNMGKLVPLMDKLLEDVTQLASGSKLVYDEYICNKLFYP